MIMITSANNFMETSQEVVPSWMRLERLEQCQGFLDDLYGSSTAFRKFFRRLFAK